MLDLFAFSAEINPGEPDIKSSRLETHAVSYGAQRLHIKQSHTLETLLNVENK